MNNEPVVNCPSLWQSARAFRMGMESYANELLTKFFDQLPLLLKDKEPALILDLTPWLKEMVAAQEHADNLRIADLLEYEIGPRLFPIDKKT